MRNEDRPMGRLLSRREVMAYLGATGAVWLAGGSLFPRWAIADTRGPSCVVRPEQTEGPYFVDERLNRSDIRADPADGRVSPGTPLALTLLVSRLNAGDCQPLPDAQVDLWHCDAQGCLFGYTGSWVRHDRQEISTRPSGHRCTRGSAVCHDISWLVSWPDSAYSLQNSHYHCVQAELRVYLAIVFRRCGDGSRSCCQSIRRERSAHDEKSAGLDLPPWW